MRDLDELTRAIATWPVPPGARERIRQRHAPAYSHNGGEWRTGHTRHAAAHDEAAFRRRHRSPAEIEARLVIEASLAPRRDGRTAGDRRRLATRSAGMLIVTGVLALSVLAVVARKAEQSFSSASQPPPGPSFVPPQLQGNPSDPMRPPFFQATARAPAMAAVAEIRPVVAADAMSAVVHRRQGVPVPISQARGKSETGVTIAAWRIPWAAAALGGGIIYVSVTKTGKVCEGAFLTKNGGWYGGCFTSFTPWNPVSASAASGSRTRSVVTGFAPNAVRAVSVVTDTGAELPAELRDNYFVWLAPSIKVYPSYLRITLADGSKHNAGI